MAPPPVADEAPVRERVRGVLREDIDLGSGRITLSEREDASESVREWMGCRTTRQCKYATEPCADRAVAPEADRVAVGVRPDLHHEGRAAIPRYHLRSSLRISLFTTVSEVQGEMTSGTALAYPVTVAAEKLKRAQSMTFFALRSTLLKSTRR